MKNKVEKIWLNGKMLNWDDSKTHVLTHTLHYGAGAFEGIRFYETEKGPVVFRLGEHLDRLYYSTSVIEIKIPFAKKDLVEAIKELIKVNKVNQGYIRPLVYYGYGKMGLNPTGASIDVCIAIWPWGAYLGEEACKVKVSKYIRIHPKSTIADAKLCGHYVNSILASQEVHRAGFQEALFLDYQGNIAEGPGENIFMVKDGQVYTPAKGSILPGITRDSVIKICHDLKIKVKEKRINLQELKEADEVFFTGTAAEVSPIGQIDRKVIGNGKIGPITEKIKNVYLDAVYGREKKYEKWLTRV